MTYLILVRQLTGMHAGFTHYLRVQKLAAMPKCYELLAIIREEAA